MRKITFLIFNLFIALSVCADTVYSKLYIVGDGCDAGWDPGKALEMTKESDGVFTWTGTLYDKTGQKRFKFLVDHEWHPSITCRYVDVAGHLTIESGREYDLYVRPDDSTGSDNAFQVAVNGEYTIIANLNTMKMTCTKIGDTPEPTPDLTRLYIGGSAVNAAGNWDYSNPLEMGMIDDGIFIWTGDLYNAAGKNEFKFLNEAGTWDKTVCATVSGTTIAIGREYGLHFRPVESSPDDYKFKVATAGRYTIVVDLHTMKMTVYDKAPSAIVNAANKKYTLSGSGQTNANEAVSKAFDGNIKTKWSDNSPIKYLDMIFDEPVEISKIVIKHAQAGGESASLNTSDYRILSYQAGGWVEVLKITGNTAATTTHEPDPFTAVVLRLQIDKASQDNNDLSRIYEFEVYTAAKVITEPSVYHKKVYPNKVTGSGQIKTSEAMNMVFDGDYSTKWCTNNSGEKWLDMMFKELVKIEKIVVHHAGINENSRYNTKAFKLQAYIDGNYQDIISEEENTANVSYHTYTGNISSEKIRFLVTQAEQNANNTVRIFEIELYAGYETQVASSAVKEGDIYEIFPYTGDKVLAAENSSQSNNAKIRTYTRSNANSQRWKALKSGENFVFQNVYSGLYLSSNGSEILQQTNRLNATAQWKLEPVEGEAGCYYLTNLAGRYLRIPADIEGFPVIFRPKSENLHEKGEIWKFVKSEKDPNKFTTTMRDEMLDAWIDKFYLPANFSPVFNTTVGHVIERPGFWDVAENMEILLDAYETTQDDKFRVMYNEVFDNFKATQGDWRNNNFNDDIAWLVIGMIRAHLLFGDQSRNYKGLAKEYFDYVYDRAVLSDDECMAGLIRWKQGVRSTNSCINGPMGVASCYLAIATGDDSYYTKAKNIYELQRRYLTTLPSGTGQVYDSWDCSNGSYNYWSSTYNQGTFLGAAVMLYQHYGTTNYKNDAQKVADFTMSTYFCEDGVLKVCTNGADLAGFKGILMRYMRKYIENIPDIDADLYRNWMIKNASRAYNNRNSQGIAWTAWMKKTDERNTLPYIDNGKMIHEIFGAFGTGTIVSLAVNIPYKGDEGDEEEEDETSKLGDRIEKASHISSMLLGRHLFINSSADDPIRKVEVFDMQGRILFSSPGINMTNVDFDLYRIDTPIILVRVHTLFHVETVKFFVK